MKVALERCKNHRGITWKECLPFLDNRDAKLLHRPRYVNLHKTLKYPHISIKTWCGNTFVGTDKFTFLEFLKPTDKPLCVRCELVARQYKQVSAKELNNNEYVRYGQTRVQTF